MDEASDLKEILENLIEKDGVRAALVVGRDGFTVESAGDGVDLDALAAILSSCAASTEEMGQELDVGEMKLFMLEHRGGVILGSSLGPEAVMGIVSEPTANLGLLRFKAKKLSRVIMEKL